MWISIIYWNFRAQTGINPLVLLFLLFFGIDGPFECGTREKLPHWAAWLNSSTTASSRVLGNLADGSQ